MLLIPIPRVRIRRVRKSLTDEEATWTGQKYSIDKHGSKGSRENTLRKGRRTRDSDTYISSMGWLFKLACPDHLPVNTLKHLLHSCFSQCGLVSNIRLTGPWSSRIYRCQFISHSLMSLLTPACYPHPQCAENWWPRRNKHLLRRRYTQGMTFVCWEDY
jgi:hypothetical protein